MKKLYLAIAASLFFAFSMYALHSNNSLSGIYELMSVTYLLGAPFGMGLLLVNLSDMRYVRRWRYCILIPWVPVWLFFILTLCCGAEGWGCWVMIMPVFLISSSIGGIVGGYQQRRKHNYLQVSVLLLLPLFLSPIEHMIGAIPGKYEAYTYIDINADKGKIWDNVTSVRAIDKKQDKGWLTKTLCFPRPIRAELNYKGVGAYRKAIFDKGLVFHEQVLHYEDERRMDFSIKAYPYEIPSTTMDKHIVIGGDFFDVLNGTYVLQKTGPNTYRLHLYSHFKLTTTFNFYASWWAGWIMSDIQNNILQVIKQRAEA
jgi:hypothetical protein